MPVLDLRSQVAELVGSYPIHIAVFVATHALQDSTVQAKFQTGFIQHLPLIRVPSNQSVHFHSLRLANTMTPCLSLVQEFKYTYYSTSKRLK